MSTLKPETRNPKPETQLEIFKKIPDEIMTKFYGCGSPIPFGIEGLRVLDLGSGSGRDCYGDLGHGI